MMIYDNLIIFSHNWWDFRSANGTFFAHFNPMRNAFLMVAMSTWRLHVGMSSRFSVNFFYNIFVGIVVASIFRQVH